MASIDTIFRAECEVMGITVERKEWGSNLIFIIQAKLGLAGDCLSRNFLLSQVEGLLRMKHELVISSECVSAIG